MDNRAISIRATEVLLFFFLRYFVHRRKYHIGLPMKGCRINFRHSFIFEKSGIKSKLYRARYYFLYGKEICLLSAAKGKKHTSS